MPTKAGKYYPHLKLKVKLMCILNKIVPRSMSFEYIKNSPNKAEVGKCHVLQQNQSAKDQRCEQFLRCWMWKHVAHIAQGDLLPSCWRVQKAGSLQQAATPVISLPEGWPLLRSYVFSEQCTPNTFGWRGIKAQPSPLWSAIFSSILALGHQRLWASYDSSL